jgi:hypothetical protein
LDHISLDQMIETLETLKNNYKLYREYADKGVIEAEKYHIEHISKLYLKL